MLIHMDEYFPGLPPLSIITVIGFAVVASSLVLYILSRTPELLMIAIVAALYAVVPVIGMMNHA